MVGQSTAIVIAVFNTDQVEEVVENAGGVITTWTGAPAQDGGRVVACGDATLHAAVLEALGAVR